MNKTKGRDAQNCAQLKKRNNQNAVLVTKPNIQERDFGMEPVHICTRKDLNPMIIRMVGHQTPNLQNSTTKRLRPPHDNRPQNRMI